LEWSREQMPSASDGVSPGDERDTLATLLVDAGVLTAGGQTGNKPHPDIEPQAQLHDVEIILIVSLTEGCNLACPHCYVDASRGRRSDEMTTDQVFAVLQQVAELPWAAEVSSIGLIGGEPLLRRDFLEICDRIHALGYEIVLSTNGLLLREEHVDHFRRYGRRIKVSVSLDGASPCHHEFIRGAGTYDRTVDAIRRLTAADVPTGLNTFVHAGNLQGLEDVFTLADALCVQSLNVNTLMFVGRGLEALVEPVARRELYRRLFEIACKEPRHLALMRKSNFANKVVAVAGGFKSRYCGIGSNRALYVSSDGSLYPCGDTCITGFRLANLNVDRLRDVWRNSEQLKELRRLNIDTMNPTCAACDVRYYCAGDCRGEHYQRTGDFLSPHFKCKEIRESILEIMWMLSERPDFLRDRVDEVVQKAREVSSTH